MVADFRKRFWASLGITIPILVLSPMIQAFLGIKVDLRFPGDAYVLWVLSSAVFFYGGWPFLKGIADELGKKQPAMMTLIAIPLAAGVLYKLGILLTPAMGAVLMGLSTVIVAINARFLKVVK